MEQSDSRHPTNATFNLDPFEVQIKYLYRIFFTQIYFLHNRFKTIFKLKRSKCSEMSGNIRVRNVGHLGTFMLYLRNSPANQVHDTARSRINHE